MVPPEVTARRCAPGRAMSRSVARSQVRRGRSSANCSLGYRPESMSSTDSSAPRPSVAKGAERRSSARSSSTVTVSIAQIETICCAATSSGFVTTWVFSISPARIRSVATAAETRSPRNFGNSTPLLGAPTWCPARPMRCNPEATLGGDSTWITRSTAPMSIPSSSDEVATTAGSTPRLSASSISARCSRETEPWCARARTGGAPMPAPDCAMICAGMPRLCVAMVDAVDAAAGRGGEVSRAMIVASSGAASSECWASSRAA